jgi:hypothetical protein
MTGVDWLLTAGERNDRHTAVDSRHPEGAAYTGGNRCATGAGTGSRVRCGQGGSEMRRNGLPKAPSHARHRLAIRVLPGLVSVAAAILLTGCAGAGGSPTATGQTITPSAVPTSTVPTAAAAPSTPVTIVPAPPAQGGSGVEGTTVTTRCPVVTDTGCPKYPLTTHVTVTNAAGPIAAVDTGADGRFRIALTPGVYTIKATAMPAGITRPATTTFTVVAGRFASLTLDLDSGIQ